MTSLPHATVRTTGSRWYLLVVFCGALCTAILLINHFYTRGYPIQVSFTHAHGLESGDPIRYRGLNIGSITNIHLDTVENRVHVSARLTNEYAHLARPDTRFWIVHPRMDWSGILGLDTVIGTRYMTLHPGKMNDTLASTFTGSETAITVAPANSLSIVIHAETAAGLRTGSPVYYRTRPIGTIISVRLASDATHIEAELAIEQAYKNIIRENSLFTVAAGLKADAGWSGLHVNVDSLSQLFLGGIDVRNQTPLGPVAKNKSHFTIAETTLQPQQPAIALGDKQAHTPPVYTSDLHWSLPNSLWFDSEDRAQAVVVPWNNGYLGPRSALIPPDGHIDTTLHINQQLFTSVQEIWHDETITLIDGTFADDSIPSHNVPRRYVSQPEDVLLVLDTGRVFPLSAGHVSIMDDGWHITSAIEENLLPLGTPVLGAQDGAMLGIVLHAPLRIYPLPERIP